MAKADERKSKLPCTQQEYEQFRVIHGDFSFFFDRQPEVTYSEYSFRKIKLINELKHFWPTFQRLCNESGISLEIEDRQLFYSPAAKKNFYRALTGREDFVESNPIPKKSLDLDMVVKAVESCTKSGQPEVDMAEVSGNLAAKVWREEAWRCKQLLMPQIKKMFDNMLWQLDKRFGGKDKPERSLPDIDNVIARVDAWLKSQNPPTSAAALLGGGAASGRTGNTNTETAKPEATGEGTLQDRAVRVDDLVYGSKNSEDVVTFFRDQDRKWYEVYKKDEQLALKALPPRTHFDSKELARIQYAFGMPEDPQPEFDLLAAARYVGLTILHDTLLPDSKLINDGIWKQDEDWVGWFRDSLKDEQKMIPEIVSDLDCVRAEIRAKAKQFTKPPPAAALSGEAASGQTGNIVAETLREIAEKLSLWRESAPGDERDLQRWGARLSKKGQETAQEALRLLRDNTDLLQQCKYRYGALNSECEQALLTLNGLVVDPEASENIERYWGWGNVIALPGFIQELRRWAEKLEKERAATSGETTSGQTEDALIPFNKAIEMSNGILTRKKLEKAVKQGEPVKVRSEKPSKQRRTVHIQDVLALIKKLSDSEAASEQAVAIFARYKSEHQKKMEGRVNLD